MKAEFKSIHLPSQIDIKDYVPFQHISVEYITVEEQNPHTGNVYATRKMLQIIFEEDSYLKFVNDEEKAWLKNSSNYEKWSPDSYSIDGERWDPINDEEGAYRNRCSHCGARMKQSVRVFHKPSRKFIYIGYQCWQNRFNGQAFKYQSQAGKKKVKGGVKLFRFFQQYPELEIPLRWAVSGGTDMDLSIDIYSKVVNGKITSVSEKQKQAIINGYQAYIDRKKKKKIWEEEERIRKQSAQPVIEGRQVISGKIVSIKEHFWEGPYGDLMSLKMTVIDDRGFKVWGSVPSNLYAEVGMKVEFHAQVIPSQDDAHFGIFKRPTKSRIIEDSQPISQA